jgi:hypothetical protein
MTTFLVEFKWEEDEAMDFDTFIERLMELGAEDINHTEIEPERSTGRKKPLKD